MSGSRGQAEQWDRDGADVRDLLGIRSAAGTVALIAFAATFALTAFSTHPDRGAWALAIVWLAVCGAAVALVRVRADPLPWSWVGYMAIGGPATTALALSFMPSPPDALLQLWPLPAWTAVYTYMCVRGRTAAAWLGLTGVIVVAVLWSVAGGQGAMYGLAVSAINLAPLLMSTFFALTIRPAARQVFELRKEQTARAATEAAARAVIEERDRQLAKLDVLARPQLQRLVEPAPLTAAEQTACGLLEAQLRDTLRAPILSTDAVTAAARGARSRGVDVILLDDHGLDDGPQAMLEPLLAAVVAALAAAESGTLTVRVLPPGRQSAITVLHRVGDSVERKEYGRDGMLEPVPVPE